MRSARSSRRTAWRTTWSSASGDETVAYGGVWLMVDEAHITTFAVLPEWRRHGIGARLMLGVDASSRVELERARRDPGGAPVSNRGGARRSTQRFGFRPVGVRPRYYSDNGEDALIMTTDPLRLARRCARGSPSCVADRYGDDCCRRSDAGRRP